MLGTIITESNKNFTDIVIEHGREYATRTPLQLAFYEEAIRLATELDCCIEDIEEAFEDFYAGLRDRFAPAALATIYPRGITETAENPPLSIRDADADEVALRSEAVWAVVVRLFVPFVLRVVRFDELAGKD